MTAHDFLTKATEEGSLPHKETMPFILRFAESIEAVSTPIDLEHSDSPTYLGPTGRNMDYDSD